MKKVLIFMLVAAFAMFNIPSYAGTLYDDGEIVIDSTNLYPKTDGGSTLGKSGNEFAGLYVDSVTLGGEAKTSWGSVISPMTDADGYTYSTDSGGDVKLYDDGYISLGGNAAQDAYVLFDSDTDEFYIGTDNDDDDLNIGVGSTIGTDARITIADDANNTTVTIGDGQAGYDKVLVFDGASAADYYVGIDDTGGTSDLADDAFIIGTGSSVGSNVVLGIDSSGVLYVDAITSNADADLDIGDSGLTDLTVVTDGGTLILDGTITLTSGEIISNASDDTIRIASNDVDTILEVYTPYDTTGDATLKLSADLGDEAKEQWTITNNGDGNDLTFCNDYSSSGTPVTKMTLDETGILTTENYINITLTDSTTNTASDMFKLTHDTSGTAAAGFGQGISVLLEDASGNTAQEAASVDVVWTTATDAGEMADTVFSNITAGAVAENLRIVAASSGTASDYLQFTANTTETDGVVDVMKLKIATGTAADNAGMGISFQPEDATGSEEHVSMDIVLTTAARTTCDADVVFTQDVNGTLEERVRFDADDSTVSLVGTTPKLKVGDGGNEDNTILLDGQSTNDFYIATDNADDTLIIGYGAVVGTDSRITITDTPLDTTITLGDGTTYDTVVVYDGNEYDYYTALDDGTNDFIIGSGSTVGTDARITISETPLETVVTLGDATTYDTVLLYDGESQDFYVALDDSADDLIIGVGSTIGTNPAIAINESATVTIGNYYDAYEVVTATGDNLAVTDSGKKMVYTATSDNKLIVLPDATTLGQIYTVIDGRANDVGGAKYIQIDPQAGDTIQYLTLDAGDKLKSASATGDSVTLINAASNTWYVVGMKGAWSDGGA
jgi:hypothetical protein